MKRPNITPSPWRIKSSNKSASLEIIGGDKFTHIAVCDGKRQESHFKAQQANARAIAALPALLTALEALHAIGKDGVAMRHETGKPTWSALEETKKLTQAALIEAGYTF